MPSTYKLRASCDDVYAEVKVLLAPDATAPDCGRLLALVDDAAKSGAAAKNWHVLADGYPRGLRLHRLIFQSCAVFYTYPTGTDSALYLLGFCRVEHVVKHLPVAASRLAFVP